MNLNHDVHSSPKEENYLNGRIDDFTDCIDFTKQYQKSCGYGEYNFDGSIDLNGSVEEDKDFVNSEKSISPLQKHTNSVEAKEEKNTLIKETRDDFSVAEKQNGKNAFDSVRHPMEPDVSITVEESNLEKTINHVAKGISENGDEPKITNDKPSDNLNSDVNKHKLVKKNNLKLPANKSIKKKVPLFKLKNGKYVDKKNESFQYQDIQSNIKFKCYKCSNSDFSSISELQSHQKKCFTETSDFPSIGEPTPSVSCPSTSSNFRITRKVYLCSACGSYYENWNLFLHMKEMHKRHICLYCLGMFSLPEKLAQHLQTKHNVVEQNLSSTEEFLKLYRGTCYLICISCEAMFSEQEDFYEHSCLSLHVEDTGPCPLCGLQGAHFPTCRRGFSDRYVEPNSQKSHPALGKKFSNKKKKVKENKKAKDVFRIVNNEHNGEMSVIVRKQNSEGSEGGNDSRSKDSNYFTGRKDSAELISALGNPTEDLVSAKQYNEKMLQLYKSSKPPEKVTSSIQSIEDSINRVVENSRISAADEKENEELEEDDNTNCNNSIDSPLEEKPSGPGADHQTVESDRSNEQDTYKNEDSKFSDSEDKQIKSVETAQSEIINSATNSVKNDESHALSDSESTDSEKLTIAFDQSCEQSGGKVEVNDKELKNNTNGNSGCERYDDNIPLASEDTPYIFVSLKENNDEPKSLIREFVKVSCWNCVYCSHAKRIAVNGKQLALHILAEHRFVTVKEDADDEEKKESALTIIQRLKSCLSSLENCYFNTDTFDSDDKDFWKANDRIYECFHCLFATYVHKELYSHNRKMHQKAVFLCIMCKSNFYNYSELLCHLCPGIYIAGQVINPDITYRCFLCNVDPLPSSFRLMVHLRRKHNSCDICFDMSSNQFQLSTHVWKHKLSHMCYRCGIAYRNKPDITKHLFWKHGTESVLCKKCLQKKWPHVYHFCVPPNSFICDECSISLKSAVALKVHKRLHSGDYPYPCDKCEEKFISRKLLGKHLDKHDQENNQPPEPETPDPEPVKEPDTVETVKVSDVDAVEPEEPEEPEKKPEKEKKSKKKKVLNDVFDLPPVNLSESDDSEQEEGNPKPKVLKPESPIEESQLPNGYLNGDIQKEEPSPTQIVDGVWNNFQNYLVAKDMPKTFQPSSPFKNMTLSRIKEIMLSDHDYYIIPSSTVQETNTTKEEEKPAEDKKVGLDHDYCNNIPKSKSSSKSKQKAKHKDDGSSSSDSSSDSDSSCSCGSNCSCSSGSSSSTSSNDSDSDSREKRKQKKNSKEDKEVMNEVEPEPPTEVDISVHDVSNEKLIQESDLETDETETDEDFYDYNPAREANRILAEKRTQLLANLNGSDTVASSPSIVMEKPASPKKKSKIKRKRSQFRTNNASKGKRKKNVAVAATPFNSAHLTPYVPETSIDSIADSVYDTSLVQSHNRSKTEDSVLSSGEGDSKRPKRKRVPLKFYGFSSDDENEAAPAPRKRDKTEQNTTTPAPSVTSTPSIDSPGEITPAIWNPLSKNSLSWRVEKSDPVIPKVNPIKIRTSQSIKQTTVVETPTVSDLFPTKKPERNFNMNGNPMATAPMTGTVTATGTGQKGEKLYCFCQCPYDEVSEMIACDAEDCVIEWFHFECVGIMVPPKGSWYCPECRKKLAAENEFLSSPVNEQNVN